MTALIVFLDVTVSGAIGPPLSPVAIMTQQHCRQQVSEVVIVSPVYNEAKTAAGTRHYAASHLDDTRTIVGIGGINAQRHHTSPLYILATSLLV